MLEPDFLYFIKKDSTQYYSAKKRQLITNPYPVPVVFPPDAWRETSIENERQDYWFGVDRVISIPLNFMEDGGYILKKLWYEKGEEEKCSLVIMRKKWLHVPGPLHTISLNDLVPGVSNTGTIQGPVNVAVMIKVAFTGVIGQDTLTGNIGGGIFLNSLIPSVTPYTYTIPAGGNMNFNIFHQSNSGTSIAKIEVVNSLGYPTRAYGFYYTLLIEAEVDLGQFNHDGEKVTCTIIEGGFPKFLKAYSDTEYAFPLDVPEAILLEQDGIPLHQTVNYTVIEDIESGYDSYTPALSILNKEGDEVGVAAVDQNFELVGNAQDYITHSLNFCFKNFLKVPVDLHFEGTLYINTLINNPLPPGFTRGWFYSNMLQPDGGYVYYGPSGISDKDLFADSSPAGTITTVIVNRTITVRPQECVFFYQVQVVGNANPTGYRIKYDKGSFLKMTFTTRRENTYSKCLPGKYLLEKILDKMSNGELKNVDSDLLDTIYDDVFFTSGDGVRSIVNAVIKMSLKKLFQFYNSIDDVGINSFKGRVKFERKKDLIDYSNTLKIGEISFPKVSGIKELRLNRLKIGSFFKGQQGINGKQEVNTVYKYTLNCYRNDNELDKTTDVVTGCYTSELIRASYWKKTTTDNNQDNDVFAYHVERTIYPGKTETGGIDYRKLNRDLNQYITGGVIDPQNIFNLALAVPFCIQRNGPYIRSCMFDLSSRKLQFLTAEMNSSLEMLLPNNVYLPFSKDYLLADLDAGYFKAQLVKFRNGAGYDVLNYLDSNPLQCIECTFKGKSFIFVPKKTSIRPVTSESQEYEMICGALTDLTPLIDHNG